MRYTALALLLLATPAVAQVPSSPDPQTVIQALAADHQEAWQANIALRTQVITLTAKVAELQAQVAKPPADARPPASPGSAH